MYFNIKCIGKLRGPTNEFERSLVFETGKFERPKFDCIWRYIVGYTLGNHVLWLRSHVTLKHDFRPYIRPYTSPNKNFEYGYPLNITFFGYYFLVKLNNTDFHMIIKALNLLLQNIYPMVSYSFQQWTSIGHFEETNFSNKKWTFIESDKKKLKWSIWSHLIGTRTKLCKQGKNNANTVVTNLTASIGSWNFNLLSSVFYYY